ncbi:MAG TPA: hypothetical protein PKA98_09940, partial [Acidimicrobiales bacterium]|nr:hypothetical protein [Acidimicrobiales bacterium]
GELDAWALILGRCTVSDEPDVEVQGFTLSTISQGPLYQWIDCDTGEDVDLENGTVTITLTEGENVTCTFIDRAPAIRIIEDTADPAAHDFEFTGCLGSGCSTFSLDDDADGTLPNAVVGAPVVPGTYTVTQTAEAAWPLTSLSCTTAETVDLANRRVTITVSPNEFVTCTFANTTQSLTVVQDTQPDDAEDFDFTGCLGTGCSTFSLDDDADGTLPSTVTGTGLAPGTYTVTQGPESAYDLTGLSCSPSETTNLSTRTATVTLAVGEHVTCTFVDTPGGPTVPVTQITSGFRQSCAVVAGGQARCWGANATGALGDGTTTDRLVPVVVSNPEGTGPLTGVSGIDTGGRGATVGSLLARTCARLDDGQVRCWGSGAPLGDGVRTSSTRPVAVANAVGGGPLLAVSEVGVGPDFSCARKGRQVRCWGANGSSQLGDGTTTTRSLPVSVLDVDGEGPLTGVAQLSVGQTHACARLVNGEVRCWGANERGQLGDGTTTTRSRATVVVNPEQTGPLTDVVEISAGSSVTCARLSSGQARCWGGNTGNGTAGSNRPVTVLDSTGTAPLGGVAHVSAGGSYGPAPGLGDSPYRSACASLTSGELRCWGMNQFGQVGDGTTTTRLLPVAVSNVEGSGPLTDVAQVVVGGQGTCAVLTDGQGRCWGTQAPGDGSSGSLRPARVLIH